MDDRWIEGQRPGGKVGTRWERERTKQAGMLGGGVKYVTRVAGKEILITGMCIRVWPKQIHWQSCSFEWQGCGHAGVCVVWGYRKKKKGRERRWNERANEGGRWIRVRKRDGGVERWGETDLLVGKREKENVIMNGEREKNQALLLFFFVFFKARKMWQERMGRTRRQGENERVWDKAAGIRYIISFGGAVFYAAEPLTVRPVTVLHCSTSVCHSITVSLVGCANTVCYYIQWALSLQSGSNAHSQHLTEARNNKANYNQIPLLNISYYIVHYVLQFCKLNHEKRAVRGLTASKHTLKHTHACTETREESENKMKI